MSLSVILDDLYYRYYGEPCVSNYDVSVDNTAWYQVLVDDDVNKIFNSFLSTYLRIFYASFPLKKLMKLRHPG